MFLDTDNVSCMNRVVIALTKLINENSDNISAFHEAYRKEYDQIMVSSSIQKKCSDIFPVTQRIDKFYEETVVNFSNEDYVELFKMKKSTVEASIQNWNIFIMLEVFCSVMVVSLRNMFCLYLFE